MKGSLSRKLSFSLTLTSIGMTLLTVLCAAPGGSAQSAEKIASGSTETAKKDKQEEKKIEINLDDASLVSMPTSSKDLKPVAFSTPDSKEGWVINIPGGRPIATPAYADGMVFVGGGYGSHEFYAFDAETGALRWQYHTDDDGPTAAVIESGCAAFNTESCTVYVLNIKDGSLLWKEWLGDPLMSQPAIADGKLYMSYPLGGRGIHSQQANFSSFKKTNNANPSETKDFNTSHALLCADLKTGKHLWQVPLPAEVITAPVIDGTDVFLACHDGTSFCINANDGKVAWTKKNNATSAPLVAAGKLITPQRVDQGKVAYEGLSIVAKGTGASAPAITASGKAYFPQAWGGDAYVDGDDWQQSEHQQPNSSHWSKGTMAGSKTKGEKLAEAPKIAHFKSAPYLQNANKSIVGMSQEQSTSLDSSVGFGSAPPAANLQGSYSNLGINTVAGGWAFQGSRPSHVYGDEASFGTGSNEFYNFSNTSGVVAWSARARGHGVDEGSQLFAPPSLGKNSMYLVTGQGHVLSVGKNDGRVNYMYAFKEPITFQAALAKGNIYVGTGRGRLICLKTKDADADDWTAWGGNARHNK